MSSSSSLTLTQKWLKQNTTFYSNPDRVYADADAILNSYSTLRPKTDVYSTDLAYRSCRSTDYVRC
jgi:ESCRT-I complex subunit TSG101